MFHIFANGTEIYYPLDENMQLLSPRLTLEMGKAGSLEFSIPQSNFYYDQLQQLSTTVAVDMDDQEIFRGRVLSNTRGFDNTRKIYAEGDLAYLVDSVQKSEKYTGMTHDLFQKIIAAHNSRVDAPKRFTVGTIGIENRDIVLCGQSDDIEDLETGEIDYRQIVLNSIADEWLNTYDYIDNTLIDYCGGYLRTRRVGSTVYIDLLTDFGNRAIQEIEFGKNILDLTEDISADNLFTVLIPIGDENLTIESANNGSDELVDEAAVARYGRIVRTHVFSGVNQASTLLENGRRYLASNVNVPVTLSVKAVDMHFIDKSIDSIDIGDKVRVNSFPHNIYDYLTCTKIDYDLEDPSNNIYTFGNPKQSLTERYRKDRKLEKESRSRGGGGAAADQADKKADDGLQDFFDAWINVDPDSAHIDLGTLYKDYENGKLVLQRDCGIDINGTTGNINIKSLAEEFNEAGEVIAKQGAQINLLQSDTAASIEMLVSRCSNIEGVEQGHYAEFTMYANDTESAIKMKADKVIVESIQTSLKATKQLIDKTNNVLTKQCGLDLDATSGNINLYTLHKSVKQNREKISQNEASLKMTSDALGARIDLTAKDISRHGKSIASLSQNVTDLKASIELRAEKTDLDALKTSVASIKETVDANSASIELKASAAALDKTNESVAAIELVADANKGSVASIKANIIKLEGRIEAIEARYINADIVSINKLSITSIGQLGGSYIASQDDVMTQVSSLRTWVSNNFVKKGSGQAS